MEGTAYTLLQWVSLDRREKGLKRKKFGQGKMQTGHVSEQKSEVTDG